MPGLRKGARRLDRALGQAQARLARHYAAVERADPDDVHQVRVASRRIRSLLQTFGRYFRRGTADRYRRDLGRAARHFSRLRDLDVIAMQPGMRNPAVARALSEARRAEVSRLRRRLRAAESGRGLLPASPTSSRLGLDPELTGRDVERMVRRQWRRVERRLESGPTDPDDLHALRIRLKNLRYAIEAVENPRDAHLAELVACLRAAQVLLGAERDVACARDWLGQSALPASVVRGSQRQLQRRSQALAARRPEVLRRLGRAGRRWHRSMR